MHERPWLNHYDPNVPSNLEFPNVALPYFLQQSAERYPLRACTIFGDARVSFMGMDRITDRLAKGLVELGIQKGERVGVRLPNLPQYVASFFAVLKAGAVVVALNPQYTAEETVHLIAETGAVALIGLEEDRELVRSVRERTGLRSMILSPLADGYRSEADFLAGRDGAARSLLEDEIALAGLGTGLPAQQIELPVVEPDDPAIFQYTGGTTGTPKAAVGLHRNLVANTLQFRAWLSNLKDGQETLLAAIPMTHVYGMVLGMSLGTAMAASLVLVPDPRDLDGLMKAVEQHAISLFPGVPAIYNRLVRYEGLHQAPERLRSLKVCISGSAPLPAETKRLFEQFIQGRLVEGYGLSEAPTATHCNPILGENRTGSVGLPLPGVDCRIVSLDDGSTDVFPGEVGELLIRSPQVMVGYHQMTAETEAAFAGGWLHTGDIARMDPDGYFYIVDRKKEVMKVGGLQVWPREIEDVLIAHPAILDAGVVGIPDEIRGEVPKAWVVLKAGEQLSLANIQTWCARSLARFKIPVEVSFVESLPRSPVGKLLRRELRAKA